MYKDFHMILACGYNGEIGGNQDLLWQLPRDMKHFVSHTKGCNVVMGRNTYMSLPETLPALPGRTNVVVTSQPELVMKEFEKRMANWERKRPRLMCAESLEEAAELCNDPIANEGKHELKNFIIGGASLYDHALENDMVHTIERTLVHAAFGEADTYVRYVNFAEMGFNPTGVEHFAPDPDNKYGMSLETWVRDSRNAYGVDLNQGFDN